MTLKKKIDSYLDAEKVGRVGDSYLDEMKDRGMGGHRFYLNTRSQVRKKEMKLRGRLPGGRIPSRGLEV